MASCIMGAGFAHLMPPDTEAESLMRQLVEILRDIADGHKLARYELKEALARLEAAITDLALTVGQGLD